MANIKPFYIKNLDETRDLIITPCSMMYYHIGIDVPTTDDDFYTYESGDGDLRVPAGQTISFYHWGTPTWPDYDDDPMNWFGLENNPADFNVLVGGPMTAFLHEGADDETPVEDCIFHGFLAQSVVHITLADDFKLPSILERQYLMYAFAMTNLDSIPAGFFTATDIPEEAYSGLFNSSQISDLGGNFPHLDSVGDNAMDQIFAMTQNLTNADDFLASIDEDTVLGGGAFQAAFARSGLTSVTIPNCSLNRTCFRQAFTQCEDLESAKILIEDIGSSMTQEWSYRTFYRAFMGCSSLSKIECHFHNWNDVQEATSGWVDEVATSGEFYADFTNLEEIYDEDHIPEYWGSGPIPTPVPPVTNRAHGTALIGGFRIASPIDPNADGHYDLSGMNLAADIPGKKNTSHGGIHFKKEV